MLLITKICIIVTFHVIILSEFTFSLEVSETISDDVTFYYRKLSTSPSKVATIEYNVTYNRSEIQKLDYPLMGIYTTENHENIKKQCSFIRFGQLRNENLHLHLYVGSYRNTKCTVVKNKSETVSCFGKTKIQDFIPRHFSFSFGFLCHKVSNNSLKGFTYNIRIYEQANVTNCSMSPTFNDTFILDCSEFYTNSSFPNLLGTQSWDSHTRGDFLFIGTFLPFVRKCYQHLYEVGCHIFMPKCDPFHNQMIPPCKEMCSDVYAACEDDIKLFVDNLALKKPVKQRIHWESTRSQILPTQVNCDYLPSVHGTIPCFYKAVTCKGPPNVSHAVIESDKKNTILPGNVTGRDIYYLSKKVEYSCQDETFQMEGNKTITCLYSGRWSEPPKCTKIRKAPSVHPLLIVLPVLTIPILIFIIILLMLNWCRHPKLPPLTRRKKYDAFVCYSYDGNDQHFAENTIRVHLEEQRPFKLCIHRRDFLAAWDIKWNIMNAIRNSNSAIIVMSQDYVNSLWCKEEFEDCYMENMKDSAFKLFVILMQPTETLNNDNEYIKSFFDKKTYLERNDPKLFKKIADYLSWVKEPKGVEELVAETEEPLLNVANVKADET